MKLSSPEEIEAKSEGDGSGGVGVETVEVMGDEMAVPGAVELVGEMLERPEAFGLVPASRLTDVNEKIAEVRAENGELREQMEDVTESLETAYSILDELDSVSSFSLKGENSPTDDP